VQQLIANGDIVRMLLSSPNLKGVDRKRLRELLQQSVLVNPYAAEIARPAWDYPPDFQLKSWQEQVEILIGAYPELNADGLPKMVGTWLSAANTIFDHESAHPITQEAIRHFEGLVVFPLPGKVAAKLGLGDLWEDVSRQHKGKGLWGKLCEEILFPRIKPKLPVPFYNYCKGQMGAGRFLPEDVLVPWFQEIEANIEGDFAVRPIGFGRRLAGYSVQASRWEIENIISGIPGCTWITGNALLTNPDRLRRYGHLWLNMPGDRYRFEGSREFDHALYFRRNNDGLNFDASHVEDVYGSCGSVVFAR
jgi:hypothetical protein